MRSAGMTRERIEELRRTYAAPGVADSYWIQHVMPLLAAAERALLLEDVLVVAKEFADAIAVHPLCDCAVCDLRAAIDRAEGKP